MQDGLLARAADEGEFRLLVAGSHCKSPSRWAAFRETQKRDNLFYQIKCKPFQRFGFRIFSPFSLTLPSSCLAHLSGSLHTKERNALN